MMGQLINRGWKIVLPEDAEGCERPWPDHEINFPEYRNMVPYELVERFPGFKVAIYNDAETMCLVLTAKEEPRIMCRIEDGCAWYEPAIADDPEKNCDTCGATIRKWKKVGDGLHLLEM